MAVEPNGGVEKDLAKGGFEAVRKAVKGVIREGWSAGQVLEQVRRFAGHGKNPRD
jgi:replication factor C subunit 2/4